MPPIRLAALDIDGTLTRTDGTLPDSVLNAVHALRSAGVSVTIVTGRNLCELQLFRQSLPWIRYFVTSNGATGLDTETGAYFLSTLLPLDAAREIERETRKYDVMTEVYADGMSYVESELWENAAYYGAGFLRRPSLACGRAPIGDVGAFLSARTSDIEKFYLSFHNPADLPAFSAFCGRFDVDLVVSIQGGLEITARGVEKGSGFLSLCRYLGVDPLNAAAVGDGEADIAMFRRAGLSIAMGNAKPNVHANATLVAPTNDEDGAVWAIDQILAAR